MIHSGTQTEVRKHRRRDEHTPNRDEMLEKNYRGGGVQFIYRKFYKLQMHLWGQEVHGLLFKDGREERSRTVGL